MRIGKVVKTKNKYGTGKVMKKIIKDKTDKITL